MPANPLANATSYLSVVLCDGSSRKLIAGWWWVHNWWRAERHWKKWIRSKWCGGGCH